MGCFSSSHSITFSGYPVKVLQSISPQDLQSIVALHIAKAQCLTNVLRHKDGVQAYNDALLVSVYVIRYSKFWQRLS